MREKLERDALGHQPRVGGVRLTEFVPEKSDGYVKRLDNMSTSFFFTNFPEETLAVDLWKLFARFGRVGEVFIPKKLNRWGERFGFVKYMEVKEVAELSRRLGDVWVGTYKLRVNLSRFAKGSSSTPQTSVPQTGNHIPKRLGKEAAIIPGKTFKAVLSTATTGLQTKGKEGKLGGPITKEGALVVEPEIELVKTLSKSYVGRLVNMGNPKNLQLKLSLEGFKTTTVTSMGV
jgi:hypothetical protein